MIERCILFELIFIFNKQRMFDYVRKSHSLFAVNNKNTFEKVLQLTTLLFDFFTFADSGFQVK